MSSIINRIAVPVSKQLARSYSKGVVAFGSNPNYEHGKHRSNAEEMVNSVPVIKIKGHTAACEGGGGALGHPIQYIQLDKFSDGPAVCNYCGLRYESSGHDHH